MQAALKLSAIPIATGSREQSRLCPGRSPVSPRYNLSHDSDLTDQLRGENRWFRVSTHGSRDGNLRSCGAVSAPLCWPEFTPGDEPPPTRSILLNDADSLTLPDSLYRHCPWQWAGPGPGGGAHVSHSIRIDGRRANDMGRLRDGGQGDRSLACTVGGPARLTRSARRPGSLRPPQVDSSDTGTGSPSHPSQYRPISTCLA